MSTKERRFNWKDDRSIEGPMNTDQKKPIAE